MARRLSCYTVTVAGFMPFTMMAKSAHNACHLAVKELRREGYSIRYADVDAVHSPEKRQECIEESLKKLDDRIIADEPPRQRMPWEPREDEA